MIPARPRVAILTVNYNGARFILPFLETVARLSYPNWRLILVDCASTDGSPDLIARTAPWASLLRLPQNRGFTGGCNRGLRLALAGEAEYVLFLNPDTEVEPGLVDALVRVAAPRRLAAPCVFLAGSDARMDETVGDFDWRRGAWRGRYYGRRRPPSLERERLVDMATMTCLLVPVAALRGLGGETGPYLDERFFMYYEDLLLVRRLRQRGYQIAYTPAGVVYHRKSQAGGGVDSAFKHYYATRNRLLLMWWEKGLGDFLGFFLYFLAGRVARMSEALACRRPAVAWAILRGVVDFLAGRVGRTLLPAVPAAPR